MAGFYDDAGFLQAANIDALIVTGAQPGAADLRDEPYWAELAHLIDWAEIGTISTLFSCLAAHAAVLHLDGIARRPLAARNCPASMTARGSRTIPCSSTPRPPCRCRIRAATTSPKAIWSPRAIACCRAWTNGQADIFTREPPGQSRFVFFQGHPEYDPGTLGREYLRDMGRFLRGESAERPALPENYFDRATEDRLAAMAGETDLARFNEIVTGALPRQMWRSNTVKLFGNWLTLVAAAKARRAASRSVHTRRRAS